MTNLLESDLEVFLRDVRVSDSGLAWLRFPSIYSFLPFQISTESPADPVEASLAALLYWRFYCHQASALDTGQIVEPLSNAFSAACPANYPADLGWRVEAREKSYFVVVKGNRRRRVQIKDMSCSEVPEPGEVVALVRATSSDSRQRGYFYFFGQSLAGDFDREHTVRFYLNMPADSAASNCAAIIHWMNRFQVPFLLKTLTRPAAFQRTDSAVLYVPRRCFTLVWHGLEHLTLSLRPDTPRFTLRLSEGIGCAEDPPEEISFGQHRCLLVARGFLEHRSNSSQISPITSVKRCFGRVGIDWARPWLNPGSADLPTRLRRE